MKKKIEIKDVAGEVLFSYEAENNTLKKTVEVAVEKGISLEEANLIGANLKGALINRTVFTNILPEDVEQKTACVESFVFKVFTKKK